MQTFDFLSFFDSEAIFYRTSGENCKRGHAVINCPFCIAEGRGDEGQHMGVDLDSGAWGCWRSASHRGRNPVYLVAKLLNCSVGQAAARVGRRASPSYTPEKASLLYTSDNLYEIIREEEKEPSSKEIIDLKFPPEIQPLTEKSPSRFIDYLVVKRGFRERDIPEVCRLYDLHYAVEGEFANRIIMPVVKNGKMTSYTGRHIGRSPLRYRSLEKELSVTPIFDSIGNYDTLESHSGMIAIVEGPFDMLKLDFYGKSRGLRAGCIFSKTFSEAKASLLSRLARKCTTLIWALDSAEIVDMMSLTLQFPEFKKNLMFPYPQGVKDPGDLSARQIADSIRKILRVDKNNCYTL